MGGKAYALNDGSGQSTSLASNVSQAAAGTDENGNAMLDLLLVDGTLEEYRVGQGWSELASGVASVSKGRAGLIDVVFQSGALEEHSSGGFAQLASNGISEAA
jgi:hypothetical protein